MTYTSPDARVRFDHPAAVAVRVLPPRGADDPHLALSGSTPDESIQVTLVLRLSDEPLPGYCVQTLDDLANANTSAVTARQELALGGGRGFRQEFREGHGTAAVEFIAASLEAPPAYVHMTCGHPGTRPDLRPVCERIIGSLAIGK